MHGSCCYITFRNRRMSTSLPSTQRWLAIRTQFAIDAMIVFFSVWLAAAIRFQDWWPNGMMRYWPALVAGSLTLPAMVYIFGLYSLQGAPSRKGERVPLLCAAFIACVLALLAMGSLNFSSRIGRGVIMLQIPIGLGLLLAHHGALVQRGLTGRRRMALVISDSRDELALKILHGVRPPQTEVSGYFSPQPLAGLEELHLGTCAEIVRRMDALQIDALICAETHLRHPDMSAILRRVCFSGHQVSSLTDVMEEAYGAVPLSLVNMEWLVQASALPRRGYMRKLKRLADIGFSIGFGLLLSPALLLGILLVRLTSRGPVFYSQVRSGRHGRTIRVHKLRTMRVDAEANGAQWAAGRQDPRLTPAGGWLRTFRIDEIPQLWNVLVGDMSFVGPRPERPEFVAQLAEAIPFYEERLLVQPGLTGWAQVCYPYGASVEDARRKLEYDLYYMKHMSMMLDFFILLDTVRTVLRGGARRQGAEALRLIEQLSRVQEPAPINLGLPQTA
jgi:exopolysaccharide biosynthesis polyprenyl glycosylphosphotransferase